MHKAWKRHQDAVFWVDINLAIRKGLKFYQTRSNAVILHETLPAYCIPKVVRMEIVEKSYTKKYTCHLGLHQRSPYVTTGNENWVQNMLNDQKDKLCNNLEVSNRTNQFQTQVVTDRGNPLSELTREPCKMEEKTSRSQEIDVNSVHEETVSSERLGQPVVETSKIQTRSSDDSKSLNVEMAHDRLGQPVVETNTENVPDGCETRSCHESMRLNVEDETLREKPVVNHDDSSHEQTMLNEVNMDFRIPGLPHSVVKHAQSTSVRELIQKIENHPNRRFSTRSTTKPSLQSVQSGIKTDDSGRGQHRLV